MIKHFRTYRIRSLLLRLYLHPAAKICTELFTTIPVSSLPYTWIRSATSLPTASLRLLLPMISQSRHFWMTWMVLPSLISMFLIVSRISGTPNIHLIVQVSPAFVCDMWNNHSDRLRRPEVLKIFLIVKSAYKNRKLVSLKQYDFYSQHSQIISKYFSDSCRKSGWLFQYTDIFIFLYRRCKR